MIDFCAFCCVRVNLALHLLWLLSGCPEQKPRIKLLNCSLVVQRPLWLIWGNNNKSNTKVSKSYLKLKQFFFFKVNCSLLQQSHLSSFQSTFLATADNYVNPFLYTFASKYIHSSCWIFILLRFHTLVFKHLTSVAKLVSDVQEWV